MRTVSRRRFLEYSSVLAGAGALTGCVGQLGSGGHDGDSGQGGSGGYGTDDMGGTGGGPPNGPQISAAQPAGPHSVGLSSFEDPSLRAAAVENAVALAGGMPWMSQGDSVLIKVAHNSMNEYPAVASPVACAELVRMCLDAGATKIYVADLMGIEATLVPGGWSLEDPFGTGFDRDKDGTIRAFHSSGIYAAIVAMVGAQNVGPGRTVEITSFREHGWYRYESESDINGVPFLVSDWVKEQVESAERWDGKPSLLKYLKREFDVGGADVPGMYVPIICRDVDHIINLHRVSTHVMSHYTLSLKNWVGIMRPDDRIWMHQISYLKNHRGIGEDAIRSEPPYNEMFAELHASTLDRERLIVADATQVIASGGPDESDKALYPAHLMVAANDLVSADVVGLSIIRMAVMTSKMLGGHGGECAPPPQSAGKLVVNFLGSLAIPWKPAMYGNDGKFCDTDFSHWDWVTNQRARELGLGAESPADLDLRFASAGPFELPAAQRDFIEKDTAVAPTT